MTRIGNTRSRLIAVCIAAAAASSLLTITLSVEADPPTTPTRPITWLAAGDSYSSGEGLPHSTGNCARADGSGSKSWAQEAHEILTASGKLTTSRFDFTACTGALSGEFFTPQGGRPAGWDGQHQYDLITFTFGGDDVGFPSFMTHCLFLTCPSDAATRDTIRTVGNNYRSFLEKVANQASAQGGNILVLGYPELIEDPNQWTGIPQLTDLCQGLGRAQANQIRGLGGALNQAIGNAVALVNQEHPHGVTLKFLDVNSGGSLGISGSDARLFEPSSGTRHNLCGSDSWMNGLSGVDATHQPVNKAFNGSFHPKQAGLDSEANMVEQVLTTQMDWSAAQAPPPAPPNTQASQAAIPSVEAPAYPPPTTQAPAVPPATTHAPATPPPAPTPPEPTTPSKAAPIDRTAIVSYDQMRGGAPYWGRAGLGYQGFTAQSNTITQIGVTWSNPADAPGQPVQGAQTRVSLCTGVGNPSSTDPCTGRLADASVTVVNQAETTANLGDVHVTPGQTYYLFYYQPTFQAGSWDIYWWSCPACTAHRSNSLLADQNQAVVRGYNS